VWGRGPTLFIWYRYMDVPAPFVEETIISYWIVLATPLISNDK
jgi:hypothetical protein